MKQICWQKDELSNIHRQKPIKQIPWTDNNHRNFNLTRHHIYDDCIPWDTEYIRSKKKESIVENKIPASQSEVKQNTSNKSNNKQSTKKKNYNNSNRTYNRNNNFKKNNNPKANTLDKKDTTK